MSTATLLFRPWRLKTQFVPAKYDTLTAAVSKYLAHAVSLSVQLDLSWSQAFVAAYVQDAARHFLQFLDDGEYSPQEHTISALTLQLAGRLSKIQGGLTVSTLVDLAIVYGTAHTDSVQATFSEALKSTRLLDEFKREVLPALAKALETPDRRTVFVLSQLLHCSSEVALLFAEDEEFFLRLVKGYQVGLNDLAAFRGGVSLDASGNVETWQKDWLYTKTGLLDVFNATIQSLLTIPRSDRLFDILFAILDLPSSSTLPKTYFISQSFLADFQYAFDLSSTLSERFKAVDDPRVDLLVVALNNLLHEPRGPKRAGVLSVLLRSKPSREIASTPVVDIKGKARAVIQEPEPEEAIDLAISQVLDIFPAETPERIRRCLRHPTFAGDAEKLISALLENTVPPELNDENAAHQISKKEFEYTKDRRNIWDEVEMDFSRLRIGKTQNDADMLLQDRSWMEEMKADVMRRAVELLEDSGDEGESGDRAVAFDGELDGDDDDDDVGSLVDKGVNVADGVGESDGSDDDENASDHGNSSVETILEMAYIDNPKLFDRDAATRRSKSRAELKARTGWGDEQIEGWKIMLERNPNKDKILQKHEFAGNVALPTTSGELGRSDSARDGSLQRGRGGDGRGRGGRGRGRGDAARDRAWKDKNKARQANHSRKRGHDKKMARGGGHGVAE